MTCQVCSMTARRAVRLGGLLSLATAVAGLVGAPAPVQAQTDPTAGTTANPNVPGSPTPSPLAGAPVVLFQDTVNGGCVSGSTCITFDNANGPDGGTITFPSVPSDSLPIFGYLYFQYLTVSDCSVNRTADFANATVNGVNINTLPFVEVSCLNASACFAAISTHFYRVDVSSLFDQCDLNVATFELRNFGSGNTTDSDWVEGATLMVAYCSETSPSTDIILVEDSQVNIFGPDASDPITYTWSGFNADGASATLVLGIGNGQNNGGEFVTFETNSTATTNLGDGSGGDGLFDGDLCLPGFSGVGGMYDNTVLDVSSLVNAGDNTATFTVGLGSDCLDSNAAFLCVSSTNAASSCTPDACIISTGSCCTGGTSCADFVAQADCQAAGQVWTEATLCAALTPPCVPPLPEACCLPGDFCTAVDAVSCVSSGGSPQGPGSACLGIEACTLPDGSCRELDGQCCLTAGGTPGGPGSTCEVMPPGDIPTVSQWGLAVFAVLLLIGARLYFGRRQRTQA